MNGNFTKPPDYMEYIALAVPLIRPRRVIQMGIQGKSPLLAVPLILEATMVQKVLLEALLVIIYYV